MYRNIIDIVSIEGIEVDAGSLWEKETNHFVLVDRDQYATHAITDDFKRE